MMFSQTPDDVCMIMKFLSNSPVTHISANTHPAVPTPAVITITCNHNFAVNKWNHNAGLSINMIYKRIRKIALKDLSLHINELSSQLGFVGYKSKHIKYTLLLHFRT